MMRFLLGCGCTRQDHEHYHGPFTTLAECGRCGCGKYRRRWWFR